MVEQTADKDTFGRYAEAGVIARMLHVICTDESRSLHEWIHDTFFAPWAGTSNGSLAFAIFVALGWWIVLYVMHRRRRFLRL